MSDSTTRRTLTAMDAEVLAKIAEARARVRRHVWSLLYLRPGGFPWLTVPGKHLHRWIVIDMDATIITAASKKQGATATWKKTFGSHPLAAWCSNTGECPAMWLRPGSAGSNTVADHLRVLAAALAQIPGASTAKILVRVDGAGATHALHEHPRDLNTMRRTVHFTTGWTITDEDEKAIARLPETAWETSIKQDGELQEGGSNPPAGRPCRSSTPAPNADHRPLRVGHVRRVASSTLATIGRAARFRTVSTTSSTAATSSTDASPNRPHLDDITATRSVTPTQVTASFSC